MCMIINHHPYGNCQVYPYVDLPENILCDNEMLWIWMIINYHGTYNYNRCTQGLLITTVSP